MKGVYIHVCPKSPYAYGLYICICICNLYSILCISGGEGIVLYLKTHDVLMTYSIRAGEIARWVRALCHQTRQHGFNANSLELSSDSHTQTVCDPTSSYLETLALSGPLRQLICQLRTPGSGRGGSYLPCSQLLVTHNTIAPVTGEQPAPADLNRKMVGRMGNKRESQKTGSKTAP